jgi:hypothetical protein
MTLFLSTLLVQNPFAKHPLLHNPFAQPKTFAKPFCTSGGADKRFTQCLQGFELVQNSFAQPFAQPFHGLPFSTCAKPLPPYGGGLLQRCKDPKSGARIKKRKSFRSQA